MQQKNIATSYATILGQMIRRLREQNEKSQTELADHLGISVMTISRIESGDTILDVPQMEKVAEFFNINPINFFKDSIKAKKDLENENIKVLQNNKEINNNPGMAILSIATIVGLLITIANSKK